VTCANAIAIAIMMAIAIVLLALGGCTRSIDHGRYGPFEIGATKETALAALKGADIRGVEPLIFPALRLENPRRADLDAFAASAGIAIEVDESLTRLHVEFRDGRVSATWPNFGEYPYIPRFPYSGEALLSRLQLKIVPPMDHAAVFDAIESFPTQHQIVVEPFVVGYQKMRGADTPPWTGEYRALLLANDAWRFQGLKAQVWYLAGDSDVTLYFRAGRLREIVHHASIF
jgi:hypothetical protein